MDKNQNRWNLKKKGLGLVLAVMVMLFTAQGIYAAKNKATTIRLAKTEGEVTIENSSKGELSQTKDMRLYSGDHQITGKKSYAWMSLDDSKAAKLDENSESELRKKGRKLEVMLDSGSLFFNVTVPLEKEESLNIRTATMVTGVRGTCGWTVVTGDWSSRVYLLTGSVECVVTNPIDGKSETITIKPGTCGEFLVWPKADENKKEASCTINATSFTKEDIPGFVLVELLGDDKLIQKIYEESGIDLRGLTEEEVYDRLMQDQKKHEEERALIEEGGTEALNVVAKEPVWVEEGDGQRDGQNGIIYLTMPQKAATVQKYLDLKKVKRVVLLPGKVSQELNTLWVDVEFNVPAGKTLEARKDVRVNVNEGYQFTVNGTADLGDDLTNEGTLTVKSNHTLSVKGEFYSYGTFVNTSTGRVLLFQGMFTKGDFLNEGTIEAAAGASGDVLITVKGGNFEMAGGSISSKNFDSIVFIDSESEVVLVLTGGAIVNEREDAATIRISSENFKIGALGTDVAGITDTLLGKGTDYGKYGVASIYRTDEKYHLIALDSVNSFPLIVGKYEHGTVQAPDRVEVGARVTLLPTPDAGYHLENVSVNYYEGSGKALGMAVSMAADHSFIMPGHDVIVSATFAENKKEQDPENETWKIKIERTSGGSVSANLAQAKAGEEVVLSVSENKGHELSGLTVRDANNQTVGMRQKGNGYAFTMPESDVTVSAAFRALKMNVVFYDEDGRTVLNSQTLDYGTVPVYAGATPTKAATAEYTYAFAGWKSGASTYANGASLPEVTGNVSFVAYYASTAVASTQPPRPTTYTVSWLNADSTILEQDTGLTNGATPEYNGSIPERAADAQFTYEFDGWSYGGQVYAPGDAFPAVNANAIYVAHYATMVNTYEVTWKDEDGTILEVDEDVPFGTVPTYDGNALEKEGNDQYEYTFAGWNTAVVAVTGDVTYVAAYTQSIRNYAVVWLNEDGTTFEVDETVPYGTRPSYSTTPVKASTAQYNYVFAGWSDGTQVYNDANPLPEVLGDAVYRATFTESVRSYWVTWVKEDGVTLLKREEIEYGQNPAYSEAEPTKEDTAQYDYEFYGWVIDGTIYNKLAQLPAVTGEVTIQAYFTAATNYYDVTWIDGDGNVLGTDSVAYGSVPAYTLANEPQKTATAQYSYAFANGWSNVSGGAALTSIPAVTGNATYYAVFGATVRSYDVRFHVADANNLDTVTTQSVQYGVIPVFEGTTPSRAISAEYEYAFAGWATTAGGTILTSLPAVGGEADYYAIFSQQKRSYDVVFKSDGQTVKTISTEYGTSPAFPANEEPTKASDAEFDYAFAGWHREGDSLNDPNYESDSLPTITGETTFSAAYGTTVRKYNITWMNGDGNVFVVDEVEYGQTPSFAGERTPTRESDAQYDYTFANGWSTTATGTALATIPTVTGDATYYPVFTGTIRSYVITWKDGDGNTLKEDTLNYGQTPSFAGTTQPTKTGDAQHTYTFANAWATTADGTALATIPAVTGNATYYAVFSVEVAKYEIIFYNGANAAAAPVELARYSVEYGTVPEYLGETPVKTATAEYQYTFAGWAKSNGATTALASLPAVEEATSYYAVFTQQTRQYTVVFHDEDGTTELKTISVDYGATPDYGTDRPTKAQTDEYEYAFDVWVSEDGNGTFGFDRLPAIYGDAAFYARYGATKRSYAIAFYNYDNSLLESSDVEYGQIPSYGGSSAPEKPEDETYEYTFAGWNDGTTTYSAGEVLPTVTGAATYTAQFSNTYKEYTVTWQNYDGGILETDTGLHYGDALSYDGEMPTKPQTTEKTYVFDGWSDRTTTYHLGDDLPTVNGDVIMTANYTEAARKYDVNFYLDLTTTTPLYSNQFDYHTNPAYVGDAPVKTASAEYTYAFDGWSDEDGNYYDGTLPQVEGDANYYAHFAQTARTYGVIFNLNADGDATAKINETAPTEYTYGVGTELPQKVTRNGYVFKGWFTLAAPTANDAEVTEIGTDETGSKTFYAKWELPATGLFYTITEEGTDVVLTLYGSEDVDRIEITDKALDSNNYFTDDYGYSDVTKVVIAENIKPSNMSSAFSEMENLTSIEGLDKINTEDVTSMYAAFYNCHNLDQALDLSGFNTANVTNMAQMFEDCLGITSLDLSSFDTSNVTQMRDMFYNCGSLTTIYVSDSFDVTNVTDSPAVGASRGGMFYDCVALRGGNGTKVYVDENGSDDDPHNSFDKDYAWIDGKNGQPGYFTKRGVTYVSHAITINSTYASVLATDKTSATAGENVTVTVTMPAETSCTAIYYYNELFNRVDLLTAPLTTDSFTFTMPDEDVELYATISARRSIVANYFTAGGNVSAPVSAAPGETVTFTATPNSGYELQEVTMTYATEEYGGKIVEIVQHNEPVTMTGNEGNFVMPDSDVTINVSFVGDAGNTYQLSIGDCDNGIVRISSESAQVPAGTIIYLTGVPDDGYEFDHFELFDETGAPVTMLSDDSFYVPESDVVINAYFTKVYGISYAYTSENSNSIYGDTELAAGQEASFYVYTYYYSNPTGNGAVFRNESLSVKDEDGNDVPYELDHGSGSVVYYKFTMPEKNVTIDGTFGTYYKIVLKNAENGSATVDKEYAKYLETVTVTVTPDAGYGLQTAYCATYRVQKETTAITSRFIDQGDGTYKYTFQNKASSNVPSEGTVFSFVFATKLEGSMSITGTPQVGETLTANVTTSAEGDLYYVWKRHQETYDVTLASGIDQTTYVLTEADAGYNVECRVTCNGYGGYFSDSVDVEPPATPHNVHVYFMEPGGSNLVASTSLASAEMTVNGNVVTQIHNGEEAEIDILTSSDKLYADNIYVYCDADGRSGAELDDLNQGYGDGYYVTSVSDSYYVSFIDDVEDGDSSDTYYVFVWLQSYIEILPNYLEDGGTVSVSIDHGDGYEADTYTRGSEDVRITVTPNAGYSVGEAYYMIGSEKLMPTVNGNDYDFWVPSGDYGDVPVYVEFVSDAGTEYDIHVNGTHGSATTTVTSAASASPMTVTKAKGGRVVTIVPDPDGGYGLDAVTVTGADNTAITVNEDLTFIMPEQEVTITLTFKVVYTLSSNHDDDEDNTCRIEFYQKDGNNYKRIYQAVPGEKIIMRIQTNATAQWVDPDGSSLKVAELYVTAENGSVLATTFEKAGSAGGYEYYEDLYNEYSFTMPASNVYARVIAGETSYVTIASMTSGGVTSYVNGIEQDSAVPGQKVTLEVIPKSGFYCTELLVKDYKDQVILSVSPVTQATYEFTMPGEGVVVTAKFMAISANTVSLTGQTNSGTYGTVTASAATANVGSSVTVTATPVSTSYYLAKLEARYAKASGGYESETIYEATDNTSSAKTFTLTAANVDTTYYATFASAAGYALMTDARSNLSAEQGGTITLNANTAASGNVVTATVTPATGFAVSAVYAVYETPIMTGDGVDTGVKKENVIELTASGTNQYTFTMPSDVGLSGLTVYAEFESHGNKLTLNPVTGGTIEATNDKGTSLDNVLRDSEVTITITPGANLVVDDSTLKAVDTATGNVNYALTKVDATHWTLTMPNGEVTVSAGLKAATADASVGLTMPQSFGDVQNYLNMDGVTTVTIDPTADETMNYFTVTDVLTIPAGKTLIISNGVTVVLEDGAQIVNLSDHTIHNAGRIFVNSGATLQNGNEDFPGRIVNEEAGLILVDDGGSLLNVNGTIENAGSIQYESGATIPEDATLNAEMISMLGRTGDVYYRVTLSTEYSNKYEAEIFGVGATADYSYSDKSPFVKTYKSYLVKATIGEGVTRIGEVLFEECSALKYVTLPESLEEIGYHAFYKTGIMQLVIPKGCTKFEYGVFMECSSLSSVTLPDRITVSDQYSAGSMFYKCSNLKEISFPETFDAIPDSMFASTGFTTITIPGTVKKIGGYAFNGCGSLKTVVVEDGVETIERMAFYNCYWLENVTLADTITEMGDGVFYKCSRLASVQWPNGMTEIPNNTFYACSSLKSVTYGDNVQTIDEAAFYNCTSLQSIDLDTYVQSIGYQAFYGCKKLNNVVLGSNVTGISDYAFFSCTGLTSITVQSRNLKSIGDYAFSGCPFSSIELPGNIAEMGIGVFKSCTALTEFTMPASVTKVPDGTFRGCTSLTKVVLAEGTTEIGYDAFNECKALSEINLPNTLKSIGSYAFYYTKLTNLKIPEGVERIENNAFAYCTSLVSAELPDSIIDLGTNVFRNCPMLETVKLPSGITRIPNYAFYECSKLKFPELPEGLETIGIYAFKGCSAFTDVTIPASVTGLDGSVFSYCSYLTTVRFEDAEGTLKSIGAYVFEGCINLANVYYAGTQEQWNAINIGNGNECMTRAEFHYETVGTPASEAGGTRSFVLESEPVDGSEYPTLEEENLQESGENGEEAQETFEEAEEAESESAEAESEKAEAESESAEAESEKAEAESEKAEAEGEKTEAESEKAEAEGEKAEAEEEKAEAEGEEKKEEKEEQAQAGSEDEAVETEASDAMTENE